MSLPSSFSVSTPPSSPLFSLLPSWQQCQSGQADRGIHSTGQSRGRSKGWRIDYVYVCVLNCPVRLCLRVCLRFGHTHPQVMRVSCDSVLVHFLVSLWTVCLILWLVCVIELFVSRRLCHPEYGQTHSRQ